MKNKIAILLILFSLISTKKTRSQDGIPIGLEVKLGSAYNMLDTKTSDYLKTNIGWVFEDYMYVGKFFIGITISSSNGNFNNSLKLRETTYKSNESLALEVMTITMGYKFYPQKSNFSIDPYIGLLKTTIASSSGDTMYDSKKNFCLGLSLNKYFKTRFRYFQYFVFINSRLNFSKLSQLNTNLGSLYYTAEIGLGIDIGRKRNKTAYNTR